jgi:hypothetical protein
VGKPEGKKSLGRLRCRYVDNIKMDLGQGGVDWIGLALGSINCWDVLEWLHN